MGEFLRIIIIFVLYTVSSVASDSALLTESKYPKFDSFVLPQNNIELKKVLGKNGTIVEYTDFNSSKKVFLIGESHNKDTRNRVLPVINFLVKAYKIQAIGLEGKHGLKELKNSDEFINNESYKEAGDKSVKKFCEQNLPFINNLAYKYIFELQCAGDPYSKLSDNVKLFGLESDEEFMVLSDKVELAREMLVDRMINFFKNINNETIDLMFKDPAIIDLLSYIDKQFYDQYNQDVLYPLHQLSVYEIIVNASKLNHKLYNKYLPIFENRELFPFSSKHKYIQDKVMFVKFKRRAILKVNFLNIPYNHFIAIQARNYNFTEKIKSFFDLEETKNNNAPIIAIVGCKHIDGVIDILKEDKIDYFAIDFGGCY